MQLGGKRALLISGTIMAALTLAGCSGGGDEPTPTGSPEATPSATPGATLPAPTPTTDDAVTDLVIDAPIDQAADGYRLYLNESNGFGFHYPQEWRRAPIPGDTGAQVFIQSDDGSLQIAVYPTIEADNTPDDERMENATSVFTALLDTDVDVEDRGTITLDNGDQARLTDLRYKQGGTDRVLRLLLVSSALRTYVLTVSGLAEELAEQDALLDTLTSSFTVFDPARFGAARERALTMPLGDPITLDLALSREARSHLIVAHLFSGLVRFDEDLRVQLDLAESLDIDDTGTVYTFTLRDGLSFHDGRAITAADVAYSLERAADPDVHSATAALYLGDIVGVREKLKGDADTIRGVEVVDDRTIRITIDEPKAYFLAKLTYPTASIVDRETIERLGNVWWRFDANGSGPFRLERWDEGEVLVLQRFQDYPEPSKLEYAVFPIQQGIPMQMYEADLVDVIFIGGANIDRALDPANALEDQLRVFPQFNSTFVGFNSQKPPFDDPLVRRAFAMAIDTTELVEVLFDNDVTVAKGLLPPGLPGYNDGLKGIPFDPEGARALLAQSKYAGSLPDIVYTTSGLGGIPGDVQFLVDAWSTNLGVDVEVRQLAPDAYFYTLYEELDNLFDFGWIADYPDPENFLDVLLHSEAVENNVGHYSNAEYDRLLEEARTETDTGRRMALYQQAEQILVDDAGIIPLYRAPDYVLTKPFIEGFAIGPLGIPLLQNVTIGDGN